MSPCRVVVSQTLWGCSQDERDWLGGLGPSQCPGHLLQAPAATGQGALPPLVPRKM